MMIIKSRYQQIWRAAHIFDKMIWYMEINTKKQEK